MIEIIPAQNGQALEHFITLSQEYVTWMLSEIPLHFPALDIHEFTSEHDYEDVRKKFPGEHIPPYGGVFIAQRDGEVCGCVALGKLTDDIGELRTLFVRPAYRGMGIAKQLVETSLNQAREYGYSAVRLDTLAFMESALRLYRSFGFYDIEPYRDLSPTLKQYICFLERRL